MTSEFAATVPPTPAEWAALADNHVRALRLAYVIANGSPSALVGGPAKQMANAPRNADEVAVALARSAHRLRQSGGTNTHCHFGLAGISRRLGQRSRILLWPGRQLVGHFAVPKSDLRLPGGAHDVICNIYVVRHWDRGGPAGPLDLFIRLVCAARCLRPFDRRWRSGRARDWRRISWHEAVEVLAAIVS